MAVFITLLTSMLPGFIQPLITNPVSPQVISKDTQLVQYLLEIQDDEDILLGIHGWEHRCPVCGDWSHEFSCPHGKIDDSVIEYRITSAIKAFHNSGLKPDFWAFPGSSFDERSIAILKRYGLSFIQELGEGEDIGEEGKEGEYTWMWRNKTKAREEFVDAFKKAKDEKPNVISVHAQDLNIYSFAWLDIILNHVDVKAIELNDVVVGTVEETKQFVDVSRRHGVPMIALLVIPTYWESENNPYALIWSKFSFAFFLITFECPTVFFLSWCVLVWRKKRVV